MLKRRIFLLVMVMLLLTGCTSVRFTTGLNSRQFARIAGEEVEMGVAKLLLSEYKHSYESMFDGAVWDKEINGITTETFVKNSVRDTLESIIYAHNMAKELKIEITQDEKSRIKEAAKEYISSLSKETTSFDVNDVEAFYEKLLMAEKGLQQ